LVKSRHVRLNVILRRKNVKKLFLVFLVLLVGMSGLSAAPLGSGGVNDTPQVVMPQEDIFASIGAPGVQTPMRPGWGFAMAQDNKTAFIQDMELIDLWFGQYQEGLLAANDFKTLVADRIAVMYMRGQTIEVIQRIASVAPVEFPLLC
jgi:hypothetical protein